MSLGAPTPPSEEEDMCEANSVVSLVPGKNLTNMSPSVTQDSPTEATPAEVNGTHSSPGSPSPLNLTAGSPVAAHAHKSQSTDGPLDLSLPKQAREEVEKVVAEVGPALSSRSTNGDEPLNLTCTKKEAFPLSTASTSPLALYGSQPGAKALDVVTTMQCLRALATSNKQTILIPQLAYTYTTTASSPAGTETQETIHLNGVKVGKLLSALS